MNQIIQLHVIMSVYSFTKDSAMKSSKISYSSVGTQGKAHFHMRGKGERSTHIRANAQK